ncbi:hypothetical protein [Cytophaga sp. FL35]|uniref:hypothetical protein n=1 Tax=Cytophaga sp. FL35 TaxID=1904456 RepID=UPI0016534BA0|nr:hypothetical protein [Cytophaga sp. FL35]MBC6998935.1 hypothetical protein [Cytophaga sp. FL35]
MKYTLILTLLVFICCNNPKKSSDGFEAKNFNEHHIDFLDGYILLPKTYERTTPEGLRENLLKTVQVPKLKDQINKGIDNLKTAPYGFAVFAEKGNYANYIWIRKGEYVPLDKEIANQYMGMLSERIGQEWGAIGADYKRLENKFMQTNKADIVKIKYRSEIDGIVGFQTQFLISSKLKTFDFLVVNQQNEDFEQLIKRTNLN